MSSLIVLSGGLDSTSALYIHKADVKLAVSFDYGSKHNSKELQCAAYHCGKLGIEHKIIDIKAIFAGTASSLLDADTGVPEGHYAEDNMASTVVPFRNGVMLSIAASIAAGRGISFVLLGSHMGDNAQYPDCKPEFNEPMLDAILAGTDYKVAAKFPFATINKQQIAVLGITHGLEVEKTYSCYNGGEVHCGKCGTCVERIWALQGLTDNTVYTDKEFAVKTLRETGEWND